jgi:hypothetical protein
MRNSKPARNGRAAWQWQVCRRETVTRTGIDHGDFRALVNEIMARHLAIAGLPLES